MSDKEAIIELHERIETLEKQRHNAALEQVKDDLHLVTESVRAIETRRGAWVRTLVLAIAAPLAAGVFGLISKWRDVEVAKFEQYNLLVDRALDPNKGEAYREAVLSYISGLDDDRGQLKDWADAQIERIKKQSEAVDRRLPVAKERLDDLRGELGRARDDLKKAKGTLDEAKRSNDEDADLRYASARAFFEDAAVAEATAIASISETTVEVRSLQERRGETPEPVKLQSLAKSLRPFKGQDLGVGWIMVVTSDHNRGSRTSDGTLYELERVSAVVPDAWIMRRRGYYHVVTGPYSEPGQTKTDLGALRKKGFHPETTPRSVQSFCPQPVVLENGITLCDG